MAYERGFLRERLTIAKRVEAEMGSYGKNSGGQKYEILGTFFGNKTWAKGAKAMHEGAVDAYDTVMFRMDYRPTIDRWCLIRCHGRWYQITSLNADEHSNQLQITTVGMANQNVTIVSNENHSNN
jgi:hypothetical protein